MSKLVDNVILKPTMQLSHEDWSTMEQDINTAHEVLARYYDMESSSAIYLQEAKVMLEGSIDVKRAPWVVELEETFEAQYGLIKGDEVTRRVLSTFLTLGHTVH